MNPFSHLKSLQLAPERTSRYTIYQVDGEPVLNVVSSTEANKPYFNKLLQRSGGTMRRIRAGGMNAALLEENREADRELYAKYVLKGWENVLDCEGKPVPFNHESAQQFLEALPNWLFDDLRTFCSDPNNFLERGSKSKAEVESTSGN